MEGKVYTKPRPSPTKPLGDATANKGGGGGGGPPSTHAQMYGSLPSYHRLRPPPPHPSRRRTCRSCCCTCCLWLSLTLIVFVLLSVTAAGVLYALYRPRGPSISLSSLRLSELNLTDSGLLTARLDVSVTARNPNEKLVFLDDPTTVSASSHGAVIAEGAFPAFPHGTKNATVLRTTLLSSKERLSAEATAEIRKRSELVIDMEMETSATAEIGSLKMERIRVRVSCTGIRVQKPDSNRKSGVAAASIGDVECKANVYVKLCEWTV